MSEPALDAGITTDIYPMPAFPTLVVADLDRTIDFYTGALDFVVLFRMPGDTVVHLRRWRHQDILVRPGSAREPADAGRGWSLSVAADASELPALAEKARGHGGGAVEGPVDTPWNTRDLRVTDPDGYRLTYTARRPAGEIDADFDAMMRTEAGRPGP